MAHLEIFLRHTGEGTPHPVLLDRIDASYLCRWVPVTEALPPVGLAVLAIMRGDDTPALARLEDPRSTPDWRHFDRWLAVERGRRPKVGAHVQGRYDVTHWFAPLAEGLPLPPPGYQDVEYGISFFGWEKKDALLNPDKTQP